MDRPLKWPVVRIVARGLTVQRLRSRLMLSQTKVRCPQASRMQAAARKLQPKPGSGCVAAPSVLWAKRFGCAIRTTGDLSYGSRALCAAACHRIRITSRSRNRARLDAA